MTAIPADVAARAATAAEAHAQKAWERVQADPMLANARAHRAMNFEFGYRACYTAERSRIELAALEWTLPKVCRWCASDDPTAKHVGICFYGDYIHPFNDAECRASALHARIAELRAEIEKGER